MLGNRYDLSRRGSVSIAIRVPRERAEQLREAAIASGIDMSTYMRDALFAAPNVTVAAVNKIQGEAAAAEREFAEAQMHSLRDQIARALADGARAHEQLATLEGDLDQGPLRLLVLSRRVLRGETDAPREFADVWGHLDEPAQEHLVPAMIIAIREFLLAVPQAISSREDLARQQRLVADVDWLLTRFADALGRSAPPGPEPVSNAPAMASAPAPAVARAAAKEDPVPGGGATPLSQSDAPTRPYGSYLRARSAGPKAGDRAQVADAASLGGPMGISADWVLQTRTDPVWTTPIVVDATAPSATPRAAHLVRAGASTLAPFPGGSGDEHFEVEPKDGAEHPEDPPAPPPVETQESAQQMTRRRMPGRSEASADMWL